MCSSRQNAIRFTFLIVFRSGLFATVFLLGLVTSVSESVAQTMIPIVNSGFEIGNPATTSPLVAGDIPTGWSVASGSNPLWIGDSRIGGADPTGGHNSSQFLSGSWQYGGLTSANSLIGGGDYSSSIFQDIDLSPYASEIGVGDRYLGVSYAYWDGDNGDLGTINYDFFDSTGSTVGSGYSADTTQQSGGWLVVDELGVTQVPVNASTLRITIGAERGGVGGTARNVAFDSIGASLQGPPPPKPPSDLVNGNLIQINSDGNWTWYSDERAVVDPNNGNVLVNSIGFDNSVRSSAEVDVVNFNPTTGRRVKTQLSGGPGNSNPNMQADDHNNAALLVLPDGRYLAMYANHGNSGGLGDRWTRWRRSVNPGDSTSWTAEQIFDWRANVPGASDASGTAPGNVSYHNLFYLSAEDQVYNISRSYGELSSNGATQNMPNIMRYDMESNTVEWAGQFLESEAQGYSAYPKYVSNGVDKIYFVTTETHPRNFNNSIFSGYISNGQTYDMLGNVIDSNIFDNGTVEGGSGFVSDVTDYTLVQAPDALGAGTNRLWTTDMALDSAGNPMALYTSRWNIDGSTNSGTTSNPIDHRLHFARWNSTSQTWSYEEIAKMGRRLYSSEQDYTGLGALVPGDENTLYISTTFDPRDATGNTETEKHEIYKGVYDGNNWNWSAITANSTHDNLRPIVPDNNGDGPNKVFWFRGQYNTAQNIQAAVVGIVDDGAVPNLVNYVDANSTNTMFASGAAMTTTTPSGTVGADDDQWHERTGFGNAGSVFTSNESGTEDAEMLKTTIEGLEDGMYDVFAYFWSDTDEDWRLMAGLEADNLMDFRMRGSQHAVEEQFANVVTVSANNNDLQLYRAYLGTAEVVGGDDLEVFVDDWQTRNGSGSRTWYDGVGYALVSEAVNLSGDFDGDGDVDGADFLAWQRGESPSPLSASDLAIWRDNYGNSALSATQSVPEPSSLLLAAICLFAPISVARR